MRFSIDEGRRVGWTCALSLAALILASSAARAGDVDLPSSRATQKILSIGGDVTEILYAIGAGHRIVAVDTTSQFPPEALREKKSVGYMRALSPEGILSVKADVVIASSNAGPADIVATLKATVPYVDVPEGSDAQAVLGKIKLIARAVGVDAAGERLAGLVSKDLDELAAERNAIARPLRAIFIFNARAGRALVGGAGTSADGILRLAGIENAASSLTGFKPVGEEGMLEMNPDLIVTMRRGGSPTEVAEIEGMPGLSRRPDGKSRRIIEMDSLYLLGFGPRVAAAARELMRAAYPEAALATTSTR